MGRDATVFKRERERERERKRVGPSPKMAVFSVLVVRSLGFSGVGRSDRPLALYHMRLGGDFFSEKYGHASGAASRA